MQELRENLKEYLFTQYNVDDIKKQLFNEIGFEFKRAEKITRLQRIEFVIYKIAQWLRGLPLNLPYKRTDIYNLMYSFGYEGEEFEAEELFYDLLAGIILDATKPKIKDVEYL